MAQWIRYHGKYLIILFTTIMRHISIFKGIIFLSPALQNNILIHLYLPCTESYKKEYLSGYGSVITWLPRFEHLGSLVMTEPYFIFFHIIHLVNNNATMKVIGQSFKFQDVTIVTDTGPTINFILFDVRKRLIHWATLALQIDSIQSGLTFFHSYLDL